MNVRQQLILDRFRRRRYCYVHPHRTAGGSVLAALGLPNTHIRGTALRSLLGEEQFARMYVFAFVRDPWDRIFSLYRWRARMQRLPEFRVWLYQEVGRRKDTVSQFRFLGIHRGVKYNFIGRYERLAQDWRQVQSVVGGPMELPRMHVAPSGDYREAYRPRDVRFVREMYRDDVREFGYEF